MRDRSDLTDACVLGRFGPAASEAAQHHEAGKRQLPSQHWPSLISTVRQFRYEINAKPISQSNSFYLARDLYNMANIMFVPILTDSGDLLHT